MAKILIVEDYLAIRTMLENFFRARGFDVITANNGREGLALCLQHLPVIVITDNDMPLLSGLELVTTIRSHAKISQTPIILTSGDPGDIESQALSAGANAFIAKPFNLLELGKMVTDLLTPNDRGTT